MDRPPTLPGRFSARAPAVAPLPSLDVGGSPGDRGGITRARVSRRRLLRSGVLNLQDEPPVSLQEIADHCRVSFATVWRWALKGLPGPDGQRVRLEAQRLGGRWVSSWAALQRFSEATT